MELTAFEYPGCPYCKQAKELIQELTEQHPEYAQVQIHWIDETAFTGNAGQYDYYYCPSFFLGTTKLYEADPQWSRTQAKEHLDEMLKKVTAS